MTELQRFWLKYWIGWAYNSIDTHKVIGLYKEYNFMYLHTITIMGEHQEIVCGSTKHEAVVVEELPPNWMKAKITYL